ncbi:MAG: dihydrodipicolinate synthase family protein [Phycisphaerae bacterium]|nr:dihydrodipicolinate synthase family protein [Phycisphaerae bacterium]
MYTHIQGLVAAPFTALKSDGDVNLDIIEQQAAFLQRNGIRSIFICGTTGEGFSLTTDERMQVAQRWADAAADTMTILVHVSHTSIRETQALSAHARDIGAHGVGLMGPIFYKTHRIEDLVDYCAIVAETAAPLPIYYYHIPSYSGISISVADFLTAAKNGIPNLAGAKFTHEDFADYSECLHVDDGRFDLLFGRDEMLLSALALGAKGAIGSSYNCNAPLYVDLVHAFNRSDLLLARTLQSQAVQIIKTTGGAACGYLPAAKSISKILGLDLGPVRSPLKNITAEQFADLRSRLESLDFFESACK